MKQGIKKRLIYAFYVIAVIIASLLPGSGSSFWHFDKIGHFLAYLGMAVLAFLVFERGFARIFALVSTILLGAGLEWCQSFVPGRDMSLLDGIANTLGVISGVVLFRFQGHQISRHAQRLLG